MRTIGAFGTNGPPPALPLSARWSNQKYTQSIAPFDPKGFAQKRQHDSNNTHMEDKLPTSMSILSN
ncbi:hypothetical protein Z949_1372 [Sulfitobacter guttiformis KCTC 32187]|nr:hypothetical protein Z949_1372 [Sulfitobacter guttiformis KCTC 32187]